MFSRPEAVVEIALKYLTEPSYHDILFFSNSVTDNSYLPKTIIKVRPLDKTGRTFEIVTGVEQYRTAREQGARTILAVIEEMTAEQARLYATDDVLRTAASSASRSAVQLLVAARDNESHGGDWSVDRFTNLIGIKRSTYTHAWSSINYVCDELRKSSPSLEDLGFAELVATAVRQKFNPAFNELYMGRMSIDRFYRLYYRQSDIARERSHLQRAAKKKSRLLKQSASTNSTTNEATRTSAEIPPASHPAQLIAEGVIKFAEASFLKNKGTGEEHENDGQDVAQQLVALLDSHAELESEIRQFCQLALEHFNTNACRQSSRRKAKRSSHLIPQTDDRQLSFDLAVTSDRIEHEAESVPDDEVRAA